MIKYAKIIDNETGLCEVGTGTNTEFYKSIGMIELDVEVSEKDNQWYLSEKCPHYTPEEKEAIERARIDTLYMTRSDFFDGFIMAFNLGQAELRAIVEQILNNINITDVEIKVALNNYDNALNFYRKHTLFVLLNNVEIPINENLTLVFTSDIWDKFFDETNKRNPEAYKELQKAIKVKPEPADTDSDSDTDIDVDTDTDSDIDSDIDTDSDSNTNLDNEV